jgi:hypothetical protein
MIFFSQKNTFFLQKTSVLKTVKAKAIGCHQHAVIYTTSEDEREREKETYAGGCNLLLLPLKHTIRWKESMQCCTATGNAIYKSYVTLLYEHDEVLMVNY